MSYSIVRPTAFFKSGAGQVKQSCRSGKPYVMFGDGQLALPTQSPRPISRA